MPILHPLSALYQRLISEKMFGDQSPMALDIVPRPIQALIEQKAKAKGIRTKEDAFQTAQPALKPFSRGRK